MASLSTVSKAQLINSVFQQVFGFSPKMDYYDDHVMISFTSDQKIVLQEFIRKQLEKAPGDIRFDLQPVIMPLVLKKASPYLAAAGVLGFLVGRKI